MAAERTGTRYKTSRIGLGVLLIWLVGCATSTGPGGESIADSPPPVEGSTKPTYTLISASLDTRPTWIDQPPEESEESYFYIALSDFHMSERAARDAAMRHARTQYAQYTGVDVKDVDQVLKSLYGRASDVLDPTVIGISDTQQETDAHVSRVKARQWYTETYEVGRNRVPQGVAYKIWALVSVPADEYERVQEWKRRQAIAQHAGRQGREEAARQSADTILNGHKQRLATVDAAVAAADPIGALRRLQGAWRRLYDEENAFLAKGELYAPYSRELSEARQASVAKIAAIRDALWLDTGRGQTVFIPRDSREMTTDVWAWLEHDGRLRAVARLPLALRDSSGAIIAQARTGPTGRARFRSATLSPGEYSLTVDADQTPVAELDERIRRRLTGLHAPLAVVSYAESMEGAVGAAVSALFAGPALAPPPAQHVSIGAITYGDSGQGGGFAYAVSRLLEQYITQIEGVTVAAPKKRNAVALTRAFQTRGIDLSVKKTPPMGSGAMQALIDNADAVVEANYRLLLSQVALDLYMRQAGSDVLLATAAVKIDKASVPAALDLEPKSKKPAPTLAKINTSRNIKLDITSHLGDGKTYREGDVISYFISSDRDAYLLLIFEDAENNLVQILPNLHSGNVFHRAGNFFEVPGTDAVFEFKITEPYGVERVWVFATTKPFPALLGRGLENGLVLLNKSMHRIRSQLRDYALDAGLAYGETSTTITTVPKRVSEVVPAASYVVE